MNALRTDLYELTMAAGYAAAGKKDEIATFELFVRKLPAHRTYLIAAGLQQAAEYLRNLRFEPEEIAWLRTLVQFRNAPPEFFSLLEDLRFTGDVFAMPEGTPLFQGEPLMTVRAPIIEAQIAETYLLSIISFQTMIASKASRVVEAAAGRTVVEFGARRAHGPEAGLLAARAAYIGGCDGTSNVEAGYRFGIPVYGTQAHSWVLSFPEETEAFRSMQRLLGDRSVHLIDTFDTVEGARRAASLGGPLWGVRIDSGDLSDLAPKVRRILDDAGLREAKIMVSGDLNEYKILELVAQGLPIDAMGVGTELATSADAPSLGAVYKLVELESAGVKRPVAKMGEKHTMPGAKQVFRYPNRDVIGCAWECFGCGEAIDVDPLLQPVIVKGDLVQDLPDAHQAKARARERLHRLPRWLRTLALDDDGDYPVEYSAELRALAERTHP